MSSGVVFLSDDHLILDFPYDQHQVNEIKRIAGAKWDKAQRVWRAPMTSLTEIREFATKHHFQIDPQVAVFDLPSGIDTLPTGLVRDGEYVIVAFPYDAVKVRMVKQIPGVTWHAKSKAWRAPVTSLMQAIEWADKFDLPVGQELREEAEKISGHRTEMIAASRLTDAEIDIHGFVGTPFPYQRAGIAYAAKSRRCFIADDMGLGKGVTLDTMILTTGGWTKAGEITLESLIYGVDGLPHNVVGIYPQGVRPTFIVRFSDGTSITVDDQHLWEVESVQNGGPRVWTTQEIIASGLRDAAGNRKWRIPLTAPVQYPESDFLLHPYDLGVMLGDGSLVSGASFTTRAEVRNRMVTPFTTHVNGKTFYLKNKKDVLRNLGLLGTKSNSKFIPDNYMRGSITQRKQLLAGLLDTDGHINPSGTVQYTTVSPHLRDSVTELVQSLGGTATVSSRYPRYTYRGEVKTGQQAFTLTIRLGFNPFLATDKAKKWKPLTKYPPTRIIDSIEDGSPAETICFTVDAPRSLYIAEHFIVTHNTLQAIGTLEYANSEFAPSYPAVVVCPPKLVLNWAKEYEKWLPHRKVATVTDRKILPDGYDVVVVGWSNLSHWADRLTKHRSYIFDESHSAKNPTAQRTKAAVKITKTAPADGLVLCLTGTPITNRPAEYAPQLQILGKLDKFGGLYGYYRTYCAAFKDRWGHWHIDGASNLDDLNNRLRGEGLYVRRTKDQVLPELPPVLHDVVVIEGDGAAMREYRKAEDDIVAYLVERAKQIAIELGVSPKSAAVRAKMAAESNEHLVRFSVLRRLAAKAKMDAVAEFIESHIEVGQKVVVAAHHREITTDLSMKYGGLHIIGGQRPADVERVKAEFQSDPDAKVIVLSIQAAKEGHTLTASQNVVFVELPWTWADVEQTYSRCHRIGQTGSVTSTYLLCSGTVDEEIYDLIRRKREVVKAAVEGGDAGNVDVGKELVSKFLQLGLDHAFDL